jgi:hypothetical protein
VLVRVLGARAQPRPGGHGAAPLGCAQELVHALEHLALRLEAGDFRLGVEHVTDGGRVGQLERTRRRHLERPLVGAGDLRVVVLVEHDLCRQHGLTLLGSAHVVAGEVSRRRVIDPARRRRPPDLHVASDQRLQALVAEEIGIAGKGDVAAVAGSIPFGEGHGVVQDAVAGLGEVVHVRPAELGSQLVHDVAILEEERIVAGGEEVAAPKLAMWSEKTPNTCVRESAARKPSTT